MFFDKATAKNRSVIIQKIRDFFVQSDFLEVETPIMVKIPGMEPYLTPFETTLQTAKSITGDKFPDKNTNDAFPYFSAQTQPPRPSQIPLYLNTSPELQMKKLLGSDSPNNNSSSPSYENANHSGNENPNDFDKIFTITKVFRNGEIGSPLHNPEFTMLEWYRKNADYADLMTDCENLILELAKFNRLKSPAGGELQNVQDISQSINASSEANQNFTGAGDLQSLDLTPPWPRFTTRELFQKYCDIDLLENQDFDTFKKTIDTLAAQNSNLSISDTATSIATPTTPSPFAFSSAGCDTWDDLYFKIFLNHIEPELAKLNTPVFIYDYPASQAALAKTCPPATKNECQQSTANGSSVNNKPPSSPFFAERFELYIRGIELANAFSELTDSKEQRARLIEEQNLRKSLGKTVFPIDEEFLTALDQIKVPTAGIAMGLDRLIMLLLDKKSIEEVLLFPLPLQIHPPKGKFQT